MSTDPAAGVARWRRRVAWLTLAVFSTACPSQSPPARPNGSGEAADSGVAGPARLTLTLREHLLDGGVQPVELQPSDRTLIEPTQQLELSSNLPLRNYRIRIFDEADRAVVSDDAAENTSHGMRYQVLLREPLLAGHRYAVVIESETGPSFVDGDGAPQPDQRLELQVMGEREKARAVPAPPRSKRRRH